MLTDLDKLDISPECQDIAETVGLDKFLDLVDLCGGQYIYIPKADSLHRKRRDLQIKACFDGKNYKEIAQKYHLTQRRIREIVNTKPQ